MNPRLFGRTVFTYASVMMSASAMLLLFCGAQARADDRTVCGDPKSGVDATLQACTQIIAGPQPASVRDQVIALDLRGAAFIKQGEFDAAMSDFDTAVGLAPNYPFVRLHRANLLQKTGDLEKALTDFDRAVDILPRGFVFLQRGHARWAKGDLDGAIADFTEAAQREPNEPFGLFNRGSIYTQLGRTDEGIADFDAAAKIDPNFKDIYIRRAVAHRTKRDFAKAVTDLTKVIALDPGAAAAYETRGATYADLGDFSHAIADYETAIRLGGAVADTYFQFGIIDMKTRDYRAAVAQFTKALKLDPKMVAALRDRAFAYDDMGATAEARADRAQADRIDAAGAVAFFASEKKTEGGIFGPHGDLQRLNHLNDK